LDGNTGRINILYYKMQEKCKLKNKEKKNNIKNKIRAKIIKNKIRAKIDEFIF